MEDQDNPVNYLDDENTPLLPSCQSRRGLLAKHKKKCGCLAFIVSLLVLLLIALATYFVYFHGRVKLHVFAYNVWGMPGGMGGCKYKQERMKALADLIRSREPYFDIFLLEELWMQADHQLLEDAAKSVGLHMTGFRQLASG